MQYSYRLVIRECPEARHILEIAGINAPPPDGVDSFVVELRAAQRKNIEELNAYVTKETVTKRYEKDELRAAQWLAIRAGWQQYEITNRSQSIHRPCDSCLCNREQIDTYRINAPIKKARKAFLTPQWTDNLLVRDDVQALLEASDLEGFHFREIICGNKDSALQRFSQMVIENILPPAILYDEDDYLEKYICKSCGTHYAIKKRTAILKMNQTVMDQATQDIYFSYEQFGATGFSRKKIISGRFYRLLEENDYANDIVVDDVVKLV